MKPENIVFMGFLISVIAWSFALLSMFYWDNELMVLISCIIGGIVAVATMTYGDKVGI